MAVPLPEPSVLRYAAASLLNPGAALAVPWTMDPTLWKFLARFAMRSTNAQWRRAMHSYVGINREALEVFDELERGGVSAPTIESPIMACFERGAQASALRQEIEHIVAAGQEFEVTELSGSQARALVPQIGERIELVLSIEGQRYLDPGGFVTSLADAVVARGATLSTQVTVRALRAVPGGVVITSDDAELERVDVVVVATGAWLNDLAKPLGVRVPVQAGRGYSISVPTDRPVAAPIYLPRARVACTPYRGGLRVGGTMEFRSPDHPAVPARVRALVASAQPLLEGVRWDEMSDVWVGPRPVSADGLPLIGATEVPGVFVAGGHGMWGITLGPITGKLLATQIASGETADLARPFSPLR
jgi:D-amino-acid dehydrogenase